MSPRIDLLRKLANLGLPEQPNAANLASVVHAREQVIEALKSQPETPLSEQEQAYLHTAQHEQLRLQSACMQAQQHLEVQQAQLRQRGRWPHHATGETGQLLDRQG